MLVGVAVIIITIVVFAGFQILTEKYAGARFHGKFGYGEATRQADREKETYEIIASTDPEGISSAIERCKRKNYSLTHANILEEYTYNLP